MNFDGIDNLSKDLPTEMLFETKGHIEALKEKVLNISNLVEDYRRKVSERVLTNTKHRMEALRPAIEVLESKSTNENRITEYNIGKISVGYFLFFQIL